MTEPFFRLWAKNPLYTGVCTRCHYLISLWVFETFTVFAHRESCKRPILTNPGSPESSEYGLTRETCFVVRRLEVVAVAGMLWIHGVFWVRRDFDNCFFVPFFSNKHGLLQV